MKNINTKISILNGSNRVVSSTSSNWDNLRDGSNIIIDSGKTAYTITSSKKLFYIKGFKRVGSQDIEIDSFENGVLMRGDKIQLSYKEYSLVEATFDKDSEKGGDVIIDKAPGLVRPAKISLRFGAKEAQIVDPGCFTRKISSHNGLNLVYAELPDRKIVEYEVAIIDPKTNIVLLDRVLPDGVDEGKISCNKFEAFLSTNFMEGNKIGVDCTVLRDFTPNLEFAYMPELSPVQAAIYNENLKKIDEQLAAIRRKVGL